MKVKSRKVGKTMHIVMCVGSLLFGIFIAMLLSLLVFLMAPGAEGEAAIGGGEPSSYPFVFGVHNPGYDVPFCSATSILNGRFILTAEHCVQQGKPYVVQNMYEKRNVIVHAVHPDKDLALLRVRESPASAWVAITSTLPVSPSFYSEIVGYGQPDKIQAAASIKTYPGYLPGVEHFMTVGSAQSCPGDSGGPMLHNEFLIGVSSLGTPCAEDDNAASWYQKVDYNWIINNQGSTLYLPLIAKG